MVYLNELAKNKRLARKHSETKSFVGSVSFVVNSLLFFAA